MKHAFQVLLTLCLAIPSLLAQQASLQEKLAGKERIAEIMEIVENHYAEIESGARAYDDEPNLKHWMRWGHYMSSRTDAEGRIVDVDKHIRRAYEQYDPEQRISTGNWIARGPTAISGTFGSAYGIGRVDRVAFHPTDANIVYIGTPSGGLFRTTNGGTTWQAMTDNIPSVGISGIVVTPSNPSLIYILTGDGDTNIGGFVESAGYMRSSAGIFKSTDAAVTWQRTGNLPVTGSYVGYNLAQDPNNANVLLAATSKGLFRTTDGGDSWLHVLDEGRTYEVKYKPGSSTIAYATVGGDFYRSTDGGATWIEILDFGGNPLLGPRVALAVSNANANYVYLLSGNAPSGSVDSCNQIGADQTFGGVFRSTNSGESFVRQCNSPNIVESCCEGVNSRSQADYDLALGVSHTTTAILVSGGINAWRSTSSGVTWSNVTAGRCDGFTTSTGYVHADVHDIEYNPVNGNVYVCTDGGLIRSANNGTDWINMSDGIAASQIYHMAGSLTNTNNMIIGLQDNGLKRRNTNTTIWDNVAGGDGFDCIYDSGSSTAGYLGTNSKLYRFTNNGLSLNQITPDSGGFFTRVTSAIDQPNVVLAGREDVHISTNYGATWTNVGASGWWDIERCPSNPSRFYAAGGTSAFATEGQMFRSSDTGQSWLEISGQPGYPSFSIRVTDIGVRPNGSSHVWITFGGFFGGNKVFYSSNAGESWSNMSGSLPNVPVNAIQVDGSNNVYIGTDIGVFYRGASMSDWVPFWHRLPVVPVSDLELYETAGIIRASTFGRGVWESSTYSTCVATLSLGGTTSGNRYYETSDWISCSANVTGGQNTSFILKAGNYITLTTGFEAKKGSKLIAYTAACGVSQPID